jgi:hypothetical protein
VGRKRSRARKADAQEIVTYGKAILLAGFSNVASYRIVDPYFLTQLQVKIVKCVGDSKLNITQSRFLYSYFRAASSKEYPLTLFPPFVDLLFRWTWDESNDFQDDLRAGCLVKEL